MKWNYERWPWRRRFALLPKCVEGECIWLEWYWTKFCGDCNEVVFGKERPRD